MVYAFEQKALSYLNSLDSYPPNISTIPDVIFISVDSMFFDHFLVDMKSLYVQVLPFYHKSIYYVNFSLPITEYTLEYSLKHKST